ncbi:hypothetical protein QYF36_004980 [Acer negundo]|nr:hypothetical protein QYF36_004980 [Acer negundo]
MVQIRFSSLMILLGFLFVMQDSSTYAHHDEETTKNGFVASDHQEYVVSATKEVVDGVSSISLMRKPWFEGSRKMAAHKMFRKELEKEIISGANRCVGKCEFEGRRDFSDTSSTSHHHHHKLIKGGGFVAFNADYHGPRRHPPKHN